MERFKIYNIIHHDQLGQITLTLAEDNNFLEEMFNRLKGKGIKIKFLAFQQEREGSSHLTLCVERGDLKIMEKLLSNHPLKEEAFQINPEAGMVAIYGPHFVERPGVVDVMHHALSSRGVKILAISTTISTCCFVVPASQIVLAINILKEVFEIPQGKV